MKSPKWILCIFLFACMITSGACKKESGILIGQTPGSKIQKVATGSLYNNFFSFIDTTVFMELNFDREVKPSPRKGFMLIESKTDFAPIYVLVDENKYKNQLSKISIGEGFKVCGQVSAINLPGNDKSSIAIIVE